MLAGQELHFVVVIVITGKLQRLRRDAEQAGDGDVDVPRLLQTSDLAPFLVQQVDGHILGWVQETATIRQGLRRQARKESDPE